MRQILGWREFVRHVHKAPPTVFAGSNGRRDPLSCDEPGDGGWSNWSGGRLAAGIGELTTDLDGGSRVVVFGSAFAELPPAFWGEPSGLRCLDRVVEQVWRRGLRAPHPPSDGAGQPSHTAWTSRLATLTDWFWVAFADAYDWVVEPNVLGMGTFAAGEVMTTKPYVCGAAYLDRMGDHCGPCRFDPRKDCPVTALYWDFLARKEAKLADNLRLRMPLSALRKRSAERRARDAAVARDVRRRLARGEALEPDAPEA